MNLSVMTKPGKQMHIRVEKSSIEELVSRASDAIAPVWPLKNFIAVNPLQGLENQPFEQAVSKSSQYLKFHATASQTQMSVNRELIKWCTAFFDEGQATIEIPGRRAGFYRCFADLAKYDTQLTRSKADREFLKRLPESASQALSICLDQLDVPKTKLEEFLRQSLTALPGWSGYVKWKSNWQNPDEQSRCSANLLEYLAVRLVLTSILDSKAALSENHATMSKPVFLERLALSEKAYEQGLLGQLLPQMAKKNGNRSVPD